MKRIVLLNIVLFLSSCRSDKGVVLKMAEADSVIAQSQDHIQSVNLILDSADSKVSESVYTVVEQLHELKAENENLKIQYQRLKKTIVKRDTIYITEKKNFWGKTKRSVDSTQSITEDSTIQN
jgi:hypothetical protein